MFQINFEEDRKLDTEFQQVNDYNELLNRPMIEQKVLEGDLTLEDIGVNEITNTELEILLK